MTTLVPCECRGRAHVVCTPGTWAGASVAALLDADKSKPPPLAKTYDCGCRGRAHPVCEPRWRAVKSKPEFMPARRMTLKQALKDGLKIRPHVEHSFTCPTGCDRSMRHEHFCLCTQERGAGRMFTDHERGQTVRVPIDGRG